MGFQPATWLDNKLDVISSGFGRGINALGGGGDPVVCPPNVDCNAPVAKKKNPVRRKAAAKKALSSQDVLKQHQDELLAAAGPKEVPAPGMSPGDKVGAGMAGAGVLGGVLEALGMGDSERSKYDLPGAGSPDALDLNPVEGPFQGRMDMTPEQRQSLALGMLR